MANDGITKNEAIKKGLASMDIAEQKKRELKQLFPEVFAEDKIDFQRLKEVLGSEIDDAKERFGLSWPGKAACMNVIQSPSIATLKPEPRESVNFDTTENIIIEGDNLEVLKLLQKSYFGEIKMIYIDPPYNTGKDFVYSDRFGQTLEDYLDYTEQRDEHGKIYSVNAETSGRKHSNWLNMMYPRLYLARNLLRDDGVIFISIDDNEVHNLRALCNTIFGEENFVAEFIWKKKNVVQNDAKFVSTDHEYVICYAKNSEILKFNLLPRTEDQIERYTNPDNDPRGPWTSVALQAKSGSSSYGITFPNGVTWKPVEGTFPRLSKESLMKSYEEERLWFGKEGKNVPRLKKYLSDVKDGVISNTVFLNEDVGSTQLAKETLKRLLENNVFDTPKPIGMLQKFLRLSTSKSDIILDFFAGSGTTGQAVMELNKEDAGNRKFILVQLPEKTNENSEAFKAGYKTIAEITKERIRRAGKTIADESTGKLDLSSHKVDAGFKVFKLDRSNFKIWESEAEKFSQKQLELHVDHVSGKSSDLDILYEILLKAGLPLDSEIKALKLAGKTVYDVQDGGIHICLEKQITQELVDALAALNPMPLNIIMLDEGFKGNDQLKTNTVQTFKAVSRNKEEAISFRTV